MGLNDASAAPGSIGAFLSAAGVPAEGPVELRVRLRSGAGAVNGNYAVTGPLYRARWRAAVDAGAVPDAVTRTARAFLLLDNASLAAEGAPGGCGPESLFRVGVHVRRGDIVANPRCGGRGPSHCAGCDCARGEGGGSVLGRGMLY